MAIYYERPPRSDELYHYGVIGMKWGQHKFSRKEIRSDNKKAFELGKKATILDRASDHGLKQHQKNTRKLQKELAKDNPNQEKIKKLKANDALHKKIRAKLDLDRDYAVSDMYKHRRELVNKYGKEHVSQFNHEKKPGDPVTINERTMTLGQKGTAIILRSTPNPVFNAIMAYNVPITKKSQGAQEYHNRMVKTVSSSCNSGYEFVHSHAHKAMQMSIKEAQRAASFSMSGGRNPFLFG